MAFDIESWQSQVCAWWTEHGPRIKAAPVKSAHALLDASAWLPYLTVYPYDPDPAMTALVGITASVGGNLVANLVQSTYDCIRGGE